MAVTKELIVRFKGDTKSLQQSTDKAKSSLEKFDTSVDKSSQTLTRYRSAIISAGTAYAAIGFAKTLISTALELENLNAKMIAAVGISGDVTGELQRLRQEADDLGVDFKVSANNFASFAAAARTAGLDMDIVREVFTETSKAGKAMQLSNDAMSGTFQALTQIAGKGVVSMEEMRQQLGERIPVAMAAMAAGMGNTGISVAELTDIISSGELSAVEGLKALAKGFKENEDLAEAFAQSADTTQSKIAILNNKIFDLKSQLADAGIIEVFNDSVEDLSDLVSNPDFQEGLVGAAKAIAAIGSVALHAANGVGIVFNALSDLIEHERGLHARREASTRKNRNAIREFFGFDPEEVPVETKKVSEDMQSFWDDLEKQRIDAGLKARGLMLSENGIGIVPYVDEKVDPYDPKAKKNEEKILKEEAKKAAKEAAKEAKEQLKSYQNVLEETRRKQQAVGNEIGDTLFEIGRGYTSLRDVALKALDDIVRSMFRLQAGGTSTGGIFGDIGQSIFGSLFGGGSGGNFDPAVSAPPSKPSFSSGGSFQVKGNSGIDRNTLSLNGQAIANVSKGETVGVSRSGGGTVVNIINNSGASAREERSNRGGQETIDVIIENIVANKINTSGSRINRSLQNFSSLEATRR